MAVNYEYYRIFYQVAKHGSFSRAAEAMFCNQPNLTRAIKSLENDLGCALFIRSHKGVKLTPDGEKLYEHIAIAAEHIEAGEQEIAVSRSLEKGVLSIGASEIALRCFLLPILGDFRKKYPGIRIKIANVSTPQALSMLKAGLVDLATVSTPLGDADQVAQTPLKSFHEKAICSDSFDLPQQPMTLSQLARYPIVSLGAKTSTFDFYFDLFIKQSTAFSADIEAATADQIVPLVQHGLGVGFVPEEFLIDGAADGVRAIELVDPIPERTICLVKKKGRSLNPPAKELERMIIAAL